eukprot:2521466-Karenia_brevis.AAC.1
MATGGPNGPVRPAGPGGAGVDLEGDRGPKLRARATRRANQHASGAAQVGAGKGAAGEGASASGKGQR